MKSYVFAFTVSTVVSAACTPMARRLGFQTGALSLAGGRNVHQHSTPRLGGIALYLGFFAPLVALIFTESSIVDVVAQSYWLAIGILLGGTLMFATGLLDDLKGVRALYKLYAQVAAAVIAFALGFRIDAIGLPWLGELQMGIFALPVTTLWIVGVINAVNLIDGLDGLAAGVVFFAGLTNFTVAYLSGSILVALMMASIMGSVIGFLFWNFNPAKIFMGDSGSYFLGFLLATSSLAGVGQKASTTVSLLVPLLALGVPIVDTLLAIMRRYLEHRPLFSPDRGHIHHRLLDMGLTHRRAVLIIYSVCTIFTAAAIGIHLGHTWQIGLALLASSVALIALVRFVGYFEYVHRLRQHRSRIRSRDAELFRRSIQTLPRQLHEATNLEGIWSQLCEFGARSELASIEWLTNPDEQREHTLLRWNRCRLTVAEQRELVSARFALGDDVLARSSLKFSWRSEYGEVSPQSDVLLQLVADLVATELSRLESEHAPKPSIPAELVSVHPASGVVSRTAMATVAGR